MDAVYPSWDTWGLSFLCFQLSPSLPEPSNVLLPFPPPSLCPQTHQGFFDSVRQMTSQPRSLQHLCRCALRRHLGKGIDETISRLDIPSSLMEYLLLRNDGEIRWIKWNTWDRSQEREWFAFTITKRMVAIICVFCINLLINQLSILPMKMWYYFSELIYVLVWIVFVWTIGRNEKTSQNVLTTTQTVWLSTTSQAASSAQVKATTHYRQVHYCFHLYSIFSTWRRENTRRGNFLVF